MQPLPSVDLGTGPTCMPDAKNDTARTRTKGGPCLITEWDAVASGTEVRPHANPHESQQPKGHFGQVQGSALLCRGKARNYHKDSPYDHHAKRLRLAEALFWAQVLLFGLFSHGFPP